MVAGLILFQAIKLLPNEYALTPREIYRPDVKCLIINQPGSVYDDHTVFYYHSSAKETAQGAAEDLENQIVDYYIQSLGTKGVSKSVASYILLN